MRLISTLWNDDSAQDMAEYGLLLALIAATVSAVVIIFRGAIEATFTKATAELKK